MKIYDISMKISEEMPVYKNKSEKRPRISATRTLKDGANESRLEIYVHTGSHVDAPYHVLQNGKTIEKISLNKFMGECVVLDFSKIKPAKIKDFRVTENPKDFLGNAITKNHFKNIENQRFSGHRKSKGFSRDKKIQKNDIVLLKTKSKPDRKFDFNFTYLEKTGAEHLVSKKIKAIGTDNLGIERNQPNHDTHKILLKKGIPIFEGLDLSKVKQGRYLFYGFPLKIRKGDGSPVRAVLVKQ